MSGSLRGRLLGGTALVSATILFVAGLLLHLMIRAEIQRYFDDGLLDRARLLASTVEMDVEGVEVDFVDLDMGEFQASDGPGFLQLWLDDDAPLYLSPSLRGRELARPDAGAVTLTDFAPPGGGSGRACHLLFTPRLDLEADPDSLATQDNRPIHLLLARSTREIDGLLARLRFLIVAAFGLLLALMLGTLVPLIGVSMQPVADLADRIDALDDRDLRRRLPEADLPRELAPVARQLNRLLDKLAAAFRRERALSADIAHELRTPLAGLRTTLEVTLSRDREAPAYRESTIEALEVLAELEKLVGSVLDLSRFDAGEVDLNRDDINLDWLLRSLWEGYRDRAAEKQLGIEWRLAHLESLRSDPVLLAAALRNLFDNAVRHAGQGAAIRVVSEQVGDRVVVTVSNSGCGLEQAEAERLVERFRRGDRSRAVGGGHYGLGLALVRQIAIALGGEIEISILKPDIYSIAFSFIA